MLRCCLGPAAACSRRVRRGPSSGRSPLVALPRVWRARMRSTDFRSAAVYRGSASMAISLLLPADTTQRNSPMLLWSMDTASLRTRLRARGSIGFGRVTVMGSTRRTHSLPHGVDPKPASCGVVTISATPPSATTSRAESHRRARREPPRCCSRSNQRSPFSWYGVKRCAPPVFPPS